MDQLNLNLDTPEFRQRLQHLYGAENLDKQLLRYKKLSVEFRKTFQPDGDIRFFSAPGRTEICGNHTDHNNGKVFASAVNLDAVCCAAENKENVIRVNSEGYRPIELNIAELAVRESEAGKSAALIRGICAKFKELGYAIGGFNACVVSDVLSGSGLSSSAAYEVLIATVLNYLFNDGKISPVEIAQISQYAENVYFKKPCGLMDQTACAVGGLVKIDFKDTKNPDIEKIEYSLGESGMKLCILDTGGNHADLTDDYTAIRLEMNSVARQFGKKVLRDVDEADFHANIPMLREKIGDRAIERAVHFYDENRRVDGIAAAMHSGDFEEFRRLVIESGRSSYMYNQNCFTLTKPFLQPVALALCITEHLLSGKGAWRVHGGGFAGTIQAFVPDEEVENYVTEMRRIFGENSCYILVFRNEGGIEV